MKIKKISFQGYKAFAQEQTVELRPITLLIGKNSSGKSAIAKLMTLLETSLSKTISTPLLLINYGVELGNEFVDLVYNKYPSTPIKFKIDFDSNKELEIDVVQPVVEFVPQIYRWSLKDGKTIFNLSLKADKPEPYYVDSQNNNYKCLFRGFLPISIVDTLTNEEKVNDLKLSDLSILVDYIGPFRVIPPRVFSFTGQPYFTKMGIKGENAYNILAYSKLTNSFLLEQVSEWYKQNFGHWNIDVLDNNYPFLELVLFKDEQEKVKINIADVGQGMSQALPLVVRALMKAESSLVVLEQPELHLHPAAHASLVELCASSALRFNHTYLIETHSENLLLRLRKLVVDKNSPLKSSDVMIYFVEEDETEGQTIRKIEISDEGVLSDWPEGVFNENLEEIIAIKKALQNKQAIPNDSKN